MLKWLTQKGRISPSDYSACPIDSFALFTEYLASFSHFVSIRIQPGKGTPR